MCFAQKKVNRFAGLQRIFKNLKGMDILYFLPYSLRPENGVFAL